MKRRDVFIQILHEVSGRPKADIEKDMPLFVKPDPGLDAEISDAEYEQLLNKMRGEKEGIAKWGIIGLQRLLLRQTPPKGSA